MFEGDFMCIYCNSCVFSWKKCCSDEPTELALLVVSVVIFIPFLFVSPWSRDLIYLFFVKRLVILFC